MKKLNKKKLDAAFINLRQSSTRLPLHSQQKENALLIGQKSKISHASHDFHSDHIKLVTIH